MVTGGFLPIGGYISSSGNFGEIPILIRMGVEIMANENVAPWFFFDLGPGIRFGGGGSRRGLRMAPRRRHRLLGRPGQEQEQVGLLGDRVS